MRAEINHRTLEARVAHDRHRDQELAVEIPATFRIVADAGGAAAGRPPGFSFMGHPQGVSFWRPSSYRVALLSIKLLGRIDNRSQAIQWLGAGLACNDVS